VRVHPRRRRPGESYRPIHRFIDGEGRAEQAAVHDPEVALVQPHRARAVVARLGGGRRRRRARARRVVPQRGRGAQGPAPGLRRQVATPVPHRRGARGPPAVPVPRPPRRRRRRSRLHRRRLRAPLEFPVLLTRAGASRALPRPRMGSSCGQGWLWCARAPAMAAARGADLMENVQYGQTGWTEWRVDSA